MYDILPYYGISHTFSLYAMRVLPRVFVAGTVVVLLSGTVIALLAPVRSTGWQRNVLQPPEGKAVNATETPVEQFQEFESKLNSFSMPGHMGEKRLHSSSVPTTRAEPDSSFLREDYFLRALNDTQGDGLCVTTVVDSRFEDFAPTFAYSVLATHPKSKAFVHFMRPVPQRLCRLMDHTNISRARWTFRYDPVLTSYQRRIGRSSMAAASRYFLRDAKMERECRFIYYSDSDMFFTLYRRDSILSWHAKWMAITKRTWYNLERPTSKAKGCPGSTGKRLTGLHFIVTQPYMKQMTHSMSMVQTLTLSSNVQNWCAAKRGFLDEHLLWLIVRLSGEDPANPSNFRLKRLVPGIHINHRRVNCYSASIYCEHAEKVPFLLKGTYIYGKARKAIRTLYRRLCPRSKEESNDFSEVCLERSN
eukprot:gb/GECG01004718.1/.p1 GENE.gb/GECG01004718.1/~~gb/GECG01004718.1/.p1  ORF type:complete len:418 (+),score=19.83 gb/GECG01004718.1/:1-1254(+)